MIHRARRHHLLAIPTIVLSFAGDALSANQPDVAQNGLAASISHPKPNALIRARMPLFGKAHGRNFKLWRIEYDRGENPTEWHTINTGRKAIPEDPWVTGKVKWNPLTGARGNLGDWETGLIAYRWGTQHTNLNGVYTLRLGAEAHDGKTAEARLTVEVGRMFSRLKGGTVNSPDDRVVVEVPAKASPWKVGVISIQPSDDVEPGPGQRKVGEIYEIRPPRMTFARPLTLTSRMRS